MNRISRSRVTTFVATSLSLSLIGLTVSSGVAIRSTGISGFSGNPATNGGAVCDACHFSAGNSPVASLSGPSSLVIGQTGTFTLTLSDGLELGGGLDVSVTDGTLVPTDPETYILNNELTHNVARLAAPDGTVSWTFDYTAPAVEGPVTMYGAANSLNLDSDLFDDDPAADVFAIVINGCDITFTKFGQGLAGSGGFVPEFDGGDGTCDGNYTMGISNGLGGTVGVLFIGFNQVSLPLFGGTLYVDPNGWATVPLQLGGPAGVPGAGFLDLPVKGIQKLNGLTLYLQTALADPGAVLSVSLTNGLEMKIGG